MVKPRIAIVEDDVDLLSSIEDYLQAADYPVWGVGSAEAFYLRQLIEPVDVVIMDIGLPGEDGLSLTSYLQDIPGVAVIILSARGSAQDRLAGLSAGADRYLVKPVSLAELVANIEALNRRMLQAGSRIPSAASALDASGIWLLDSQGWRLTAPNGNALVLTTSEFILLKTLIEVQGEIVSKKSIAGEVFGARVLNGGERLDVLLARLRKKVLVFTGLVLPLKTAHKLGYGFTAPARLLLSMGRLRQDSI